MDAPDCGLYIRVPDDYDFEAILAKLRHIFFVPKQSNYKKNMHVVEFPGAVADSTKAEEVKGLVGFGKTSGFVTIVRDHIGHAGEWQADGVILNDLTNISVAREALGADAIIGVQCGLSREAAEAAEKSGADYVAFSAGGGTQLPPVDLISWWSTRTDVPCVVDGPVSNDDCAVYVRAGATFLNATDYIMKHDRHAILQATADILHAIDGAANLKAN